MRLLLDTHVLLWALGTPERLSVGFRAELDSAQVFVSAASVWEVAIKAGLGKLGADAREVLEATKDAGFELLPVTGAHAAKVAELPRVHRDPFDRLLVAQALHEPLVLVSVDEILRGYGEIVRLL